MAGRLDASRVRRSAVSVMAAWAVASGCGRDAEPPPGAAIRGRIAVAPAERLPFATAAQAGYGGVGTVARAGRTAAIRGRVKPADSAVWILDARTGRRVRARVDDRGAFAARLGPVPPGATPVIVTAAGRGRLSWAENLLLVRPGARLEPPPTVVVPPRDRTPPAAVLTVAGVVQPAGGTATLRAFRPDQSSAARPVRLRDSRLDALGETRDADGGALRIRVTVTAAVSCEDRRTGRVRRVPRLWRRPPAAIVRLVVPPGRRLPTVRRRRVRIDLAASACGRDRARRVDGQVEADATNATELEESTPVWFTAPLR